MQRPVRIKPHVRRRPTPRGEDYGYAVSMWLAEVQRRKNPLFNVPAAQLKRDYWEGGYYCKKALHQSFIKFTGLDITPATLVREISERVALEKANKSGQIKNDSGAVVFMYHRVAYRFRGLEIRPVDSSAMA